MLAHPQKEYFGNPQVLIHHELNLNEGKIQQHVITQTCIPRIGVRCSSNNWERMRKEGKGGNMAVVWQCEKEIKQYWNQTVDLNSCKAKHSNTRRGQLILSKHRAMFIWIRIQVKKSLDSNCPNSWGGTESVKLFDIISQRQLPICVVEGGGLFNIVTNTTSGHFTNECPLNRRIRCNQETYICVDVISAFRANGYRAIFGRKVSTWFCWIKAAVVGRVKVWGVKFKTVADLHEYYGMYESAGSHRAVNEPVMVKHEWS